jgi:hypothetical protein
MKQGPVVSKQTGQSAGAGTLIGINALDGELREALCYRRHCQESGDEPQAPFIGSNR